jgi:hypothetical protein
MSELGRIGGNSQTILLARWPHDQRLYNLELMQWETYQVNFL